MNDGTVMVDRPLYAPLEWTRDPLTPLPYVYESDSEEAWRLWDACCQQMEQRQ